jgi:hypothetical protein
MGRANHTLCNSASGYRRSWFFSTINANIAIKKETVEKVAAKRGRPKKGEHQRAINQSN